VREEEGNKEPSREGIEERERERVLKRERPPRGEEGVSSQRVGREE